MTPITPADLRILAAALEEEVYDLDMETPASLAECKGHDDLVRFAVSELRDAADHLAALQTPGVSP